MKTNKIFDSVLTHFNMSTDMLSARMINGLVYRVGYIKNLATTDGILAGAIINAAPALIIVDAKLYNDQSEKMDQLMAHEAEHLKRGMIKVSLSDIRTCTDISDLYLTEEQIINAKVAPLLYRAYQEKMDEDINLFRESVVGAGVMALAYQSQKMYLHIEKILCQEDKASMMPPWYINEWGER